jgi:hypothetical protein
MRSRPRPPADVLTHLLLGNAAQGVVDDFDPVRHPFAIVAALIGDAVIPVRQYRVVELDDQPGVGDDRVLLVERVDTTARYSSCEA